MDRKTLLRYIVAAALAVAACGDDDGDGDDTGGGADSGTCGGLTYNGFAKALIDTNCVGCHGPATAAMAENVRLDTLASVKTNSEHIIEHAVELVEPAMPKGLPPLPEAQRQQLRQWLECGAPP
jgi:hypothetical protein